jgi:hypothetical protein
MNFQRMKIDSERRDVKSSLPGQVPLGPGAA